MTRQLVRRAKGQSKFSFKQYNLDPYYKVATVKFFFFNFSFFSDGQFLYWIPAGLKSRVIKFIKNIYISFVVVLNKRLCVNYFYYNTIISQGPYDWHRQQ